MKLKHINEIFKDKIRLVMSLSSQFFDTMGICTALTSQTIHTVGKVMLADQGQ